MKDLRLYLRDFPFKPNIFIVDSIAYTFYEGTNTATAMLQLVHKGATDKCHPRRTATNFQLL